MGAFPAYIPGRPGDSAGLPRGVVDSGVILATGGIRAGAGVARLGSGGVADREPQENAQKATSWWLRRWRYLSCARSERCCVLSLKNASTATRACKGFLQIPPANIPLDKRGNDALGSLGTNGSASTINVSACILPNVLLLAPRIRPKRGEPFSTCAGITCFIY